MKLTLFLTGMCIGFLIGAMFIAFIAGRDWQHKIDAGQCAWKDKVYSIELLERSM